MRSADNAILIQCDLFTWAIRDYNLSRKLTVHKRHCEYLFYCHYRNFGSHVSRTHYDKRVNVTLGETRTKLFITGRNLLKDTGHLW